MNYNKFIIIAAVINGLVGFYLWCSLVLFHNQPWALSSNGLGLSDHKMLWQRKIYMFLAGILCVPIINSLPSKAAIQTSCATPPRYVQLITDFDFTEKQESDFLANLSLPCGEPENFLFLETRLDRYLRSIGVSPTAVKTEDGQTEHVASVIIRTGRGKTASVVLPTNSGKVGGGILSDVRIRGSSIEGTVVRVSFVADMDFVRRVGGAVKIQWLRNGEPISGAMKSTYRLSSQDVAASISVVVGVYVKSRLIDFQKSHLNTTVKMAEKLPEARQVRLVGNPVVGEALRLIYSFKDRNLEDREKNSKITWWKDGTLIPGANALTYKIRANDVGSVLAARIVPTSDDGLSGKPITVSIAGTVGDGLVKLTPAVLSRVAAGKGSAGSNIEFLRDLMPDKKRGVVVSNGNESASLLRDDFMTPGFKLSPASPRVFVGLKETKSQLLPASVFDNIAVAHLGQKINLDLLKTLLEEVNLAYKEAGFELSRALLPEQVVTNGRIKLKLVEVTVGQVKFENNKNIADAFLRSQFAVAEGQFINLDKVETALRAYNASNKSQLSTELAPGSDYGTTDLFVKVNEPDQVELPTFSVDNYNKGLTSLVPKSFTTTFNNLFGKDDELTIGLADGIGTKSFTAGFSLPVGSPGTNLSVNYAGAETKSVTENEDLVGYRGTSQSVGAAMSFPIDMRPRWMTFGSVAVGHGVNDLVAPSTGDLLTKSKTQKLVLGTSTSFSDKDTQFTIAPSWHLIHLATEIPPTNKWVQKLDTEFSLSQLISPRVTANLGGRAMYSESKSFLNMPDEIINVGGPGSVRAYRPSESSGYRGYTVTGELRTDLKDWDNLKLPSWMPSLQPYVFLDHTRAQQVFNVTNRSDKWSGGGVGLTIPSLFDFVSFDTHWAVPLDTNVHEAEKRAYDDDLLQFSIKAKVKLD